MIGHLLDTDTCIYIIKRKPPQAIARLQSLDIATVAISSVTLSQLEYGVAKSSKPEQNRLALAKFVAPLEVSPYDDQAAVNYGRIRAELEHRGAPIGPLDNLAAAHALALDATLVTNNVREFSRVPGLAIENWVEGPA